jgi:hypothetical protein
MWFLVMPGFIWGFPIHTPCCRPVQDVDRCPHRFAPEHGRHAHAFQQTPRHFDNGLVSVLHNAILLWGVRRRGEVLDAILIAE